MSKFDAQKVLCSWGLHSHSKKALFECKDVKFKFIIPICPHCERPKRKHMKMIYPDGRVSIDRAIYNRLVDVLKSSRMILNGFPGEVRNLSESLQGVLKSLRKD